MRQHSFGTLSSVSTLTLGGGGLGMLWGSTTHDECIATVRAAVEAGITLLELGAALRQRQGRAGRGRGVWRDPARRRPRHQQVQPGQSSGRRDRGHPAPLDRGQPATPAPVQARPVLPALQRRAGPGVRGGMGRCRQPHDAVSGVHGACPPSVREAGGRGIDWRLGPDRHRPPRHHHPAAE